MSMVFRIGLLALALSLCASLGKQALEMRENAKLTEELCGVVGNFLEVGSVRETFEGLSRGLVNSGRHDACVGVVDNGRSFAPDCMDPAKAYQTTVCRAEANKGIRAEIHYPTAPLFGHRFLVAFFVACLLLSGLFSGIRALARAVSLRVASGIAASLAPGSAPTQRDVLARSMDWLLGFLGVSRSIREKGRDFENQLGKFESRVREEAALRARSTAKAEEAEAYIEKVRQIRHDVRSPLSSLFALKEVVSRDPLAGQALASAIRGIEQMVEDLGRLEQENESPELAILEVLAEEVASILRPRFRSAKSVSLLLEYGDELSPVSVVPRSLRRVIENLLENAFDAVGNGGTIHLRVFRSERECFLAVEDNGIGVSPELITRLFAKGATFGKVNGTGLGLYHAKQILESWGGTVSYEPLAVGSRFQIRLPLLQVGASFVNVPQDYPLVIVDDDPEVPRRLESAGYKIHDAAENFAEGERLLAGSLSNVAILVDFRLDGDHRGTDLITKLPAGSTALLCTNDFTSADVIRRVKNLGIKIVPKPLAFCRRHPREHEQSTTFDTGVAKSGGRRQMP
jgi:signal transduction histidine kinase